jgi:hypothetical protein
MREAAFVALCFVSVLVYGQGDSVIAEEQDGSLEALLTRAPDNTPASKQYSSENITIRKFDDKKWHEIVDSKNYSDKRTRNTPQREMQGGGKQPQNSGTRAQQPEEDNARYSYDDDTETLDMSWLGPIGEIIFYLAIATIIIVILVQVIRTTSFKPNPKRAQTSIDGAEDGQDITLLDTENLISQAHAARNYKLAIRLHFLDLLKKLNENGLITWTKDKTNRDYLRELFSKHYYFEEIRKLTLAYEQVWYGEHAPGEERYEELRGEFQGINQKLKAS